VLWSSLRPNLYTTVHLHVAQAHHPLTSPHWAGPCPSNRTAQQCTLRVTVQPLNSWYAMGGPGQLDHCRTAAQVISTTRHCLRFKVAPSPRRVSSASRVRHLTLISQLRCQTCGGSGVTLPRPSLTTFANCHQPKCRPICWRPPI
jgi:hypothetical protein